MFLLIDLKLQLDADTLCDPVLVECVYAYIIVSALVQSADPLFGFKHHVAVI